MTEIEKAIVFIIEMYKSIDPSKTINIHKISMETIPILKVIIQALQEKQERDKGCDWCEGVFKNNLVSADTMRELESKMRIQQGNYCPMCGKKLGECNE